MSTTANDFMAGTHNIRLSGPEDAITVMECGLSGMIFTPDDIDAAAAAFGDQVLPGH